MTGVETGGGGGHLCAVSGQRAVSSGQGEAMPETCLRIDSGHPGKGGQFSSAVSGWVP